MSPAWHSIIPRHAESPAATQFSVSVLYVSGGATSAAAGYEEGEREKGEGEGGSERQ